MRLIDADKLKVYLQEYLHYEHAISWVDAQPTAFDLDKVVQELEELMRFNEEKKKEMYENGYWEEFDLYEDMNHGIGRAICIVRNGVKAGGIDERD